MIEAVGPGRNERMGTLVGVVMTVSLLLPVLGCGKKPGHQRSPPVLGVYQSTTCDQSLFTGGECIKLELRSAREFSLTRLNYSPHAEGETRARRAIGTWEFAPGTLRLTVKVMYPEIPRSNPELLFGSGRRVSIKVELAVSQSTVQGDLGALGMGRVILRLRGG